MVPSTELIFMSSDGLKLYRKPNGSYLAKNVNDFLSIIGCIMIDMNSSSESDQEIASKFLERIKRNDVYSIETRKLITVRW